MTEADTCRRFVVPLLQKAGWDNEPHSIAEQRFFTANVGQLSNTPIPVPPLAQQRGILAELDALQAEVDALKRLQAETAAELEALLPAILDRAFEGDL